MKAEPVDSLSIPLVAAALESSSRFAIELVDVCDSTNTMLLEQAQQDAPSGTVIVCERQTAGRGRRGRSWLSAPLDSLTFSLLWRFAEGQPLAGLSLATGVAAARALEALGAPGVQLKWPNDILADGRKLGGILVETLSAGERRAAVIGIGLNIRLSRKIADALADGASALEAVMPRPPSRNQLLAGLLDALHLMLNEFERGGFARFAAEWSSRHAHAGRSVRILAEGAEPIMGRCAGIDADGALLLETAAGVRRIVSGDVSLRQP